MLMVLSKNSVEERHRERWGWGGGETYTNPKLSHLQKHWHSHFARLPYKLAPQRQKFVSEVVKVSHLAMGSARGNINNNNRHLSRPLSGKPGALTIQIEDTNACARTHINEKVDR